MPVFMTMPYDVQPLELNDKNQIKNSWMFEVQ
jgi:hypothetical protein